MKKENEKSVYRRKANNYVSLTTLITQFDAVFTNVRANVSSVQKPDSNLIINLYLQWTTWVSTKIKLCLRAKTANTWSVNVANDYMKMNTCAKGLLQWRSNWWFFCHYWSTHFNSKEFLQAVKEIQAKWFIVNCH